MMNVFGMKIVGVGEDIIANITKGTNQFGRTSYTLSKPAAVVMQQGPGGQMQMGLADFLMFANKKECTIDEGQIIFMYEPMTEILNAYNTQFGSGLVIPPNTSGILPFRK